MKNGEQSAFPFGSIGLTKREYFASMAMQALITRQIEDTRYINNIGLPDIETISEQSIAYADSLLLKLKSVGGI